MWLKSGAENMSNSVVNYLTTNMDRNSTTLTISRCQSFKDVRTFSTVLLKAKEEQLKNLKYKPKNTKEPTNTQKW